MLNQPYITVNEAASLLGVNRVTVLTMIRDGRLKAWRVPGAANHRWRIERPHGDLFKKRGPTPKADSRTSFTWNAIHPKINLERPAPGCATFEDFMIAKIDYERVAA